MKKNMLRLIAVDLIVLTVFCLAAFLIPFIHTAAFWLSFAFGVLAIGAQIYFLGSAFGGELKSKVYGFPIAKAGVLYLAMQLLLSFLGMALAERVNVKAVILMNAIVLALAAIGCIANTAVREEVQRQETAAKADTAAMTQIKAMAAALAAQAKDADVKKVLESLSEEIRYSDPLSNAASQGLEQQLMGTLQAIQTVLADAGAAAALAESAKELLSRRNLICRQNKGK